MREYRVWRKDEERALRRGVTKHGTGAWEMIRTDPEFAETLKDRTGVQLKDKWRNLVKFNHLSPDEMKASCGGSARTRSGLRQRQRSTSPRCRASRSQTRRGGSPPAPMVVDTLTMTAAEKQSLLKDLRATRERMVTSPDPVKSEDPVTDGERLAAVDAVIAAIEARVDSAGYVGLGQADLQRCPSQVIARVRRHLPAMTCELLAAVAAVSPVATAAVPLLGSNTMTGPAKAAQAALERAVAGGSLGESPASAAAVSVSPTHSRQHSGELQRKRSRELSSLDEADTKATGMHTGEGGDRKLLTGSQAPTVITTGDEPARPAAPARDASRAGPPRSMRSGAPHRRRHSIGRTCGAISASDLMASSMRDCNSHATLQRELRADGADSAAGASAAHVEDDFLQSLYRSCFSKQGDSGDALLYSPSPCPLSPTWSGQPLFSAPTRASAPQLPIGCSSPTPNYLRTHGAVSASPRLHRPGSVPPKVSQWPSPGAPAASTAALSPPLSNSSASTAVPNVAYAGARGLYPASGASFRWPRSSSSLSHPTSVSSLVTSDGIASAVKNTFGKGGSGAYAPMDIFGARQGVFGGPAVSPSAQHAGDVSGLQMLLGEWAPQHAPQRVSANGRYPCMRVGGGPPMSTMNLSPDAWGAQRGGGAFGDAKAAMGGHGECQAMDEGLSDASGSAGASGLGGMAACAQTTNFADVTDAYGMSLIHRGDFQGVLDSLNELESCYERPVVEMDDLFPSSRSTMSFV